MGGARLVMGGARLAMGDGGKNNKIAPKKPNNYRKLKSLQNPNIFI